MSFDIKLDGRGIWFTIHTLSLNAKTDELKNAFVLMINSLCDHFGCESCKPHFKHFIETHPIKNYYHVLYKGEDYGLFKWSWEFHNEVNKRLKKPQLSFDQALLKYKNFVCKNCHKENPILVEIKEKESTETYQLMDNY